MSSGGSTTWLLQRVSGALLFVVLATHFYIYHYFMGPGMWGFDSIGYGATDLETLRLMAEDPEMVRFYALARLFAHPIWKIFDVLFISLAAYHGFYGIATTIDDIVTNERWRMIGNWTAYLAGAVLWVIGVRAVIRFNPALF